MIKVYRLITFCIAATLGFMPALAQEKASEKKGGVSGYVVDAIDGEPLPGCNVMLMTSDTTRMIAGSTTTATGEFHVADIRKGKYILKMSFIGYENQYKSVTIESRRTGAKVGKITLRPTATMLDEAVIKGKLQEMIVNGDTLQYNADAFKVPEGSVLEDLVKKLPGAEVEEDGTIKINGKQVKKILVEGKEFFSNETSMAMKNLPTEIVDKVKAYDKQSDNARLTGIDDGEEETVIDLTIKKGMKNGWFGNINGGVGTEDRYTGRTMINRFQDNLQASLIGNYGNTGGGGTRTNGQTGLNLNLGFEDLELGGNVRYNWSKNNTYRYSSTQNFISTNSSFSNSYNRSINRSKNVGSDLKIEWKPDSLSRLLFRPRFTFGGSDSEGNSLSATFNDDPYANGVTNPLEEEDRISRSIRVNRNESGSLSEDENYNAGGNLTYVRRLNRKGRNVSVNLSGNYSKSESESHSMSDVIYYQRGDSTALTHRYRTTPNENKDFSAGFTYSEPIFDNVHLQFTYRYNYNKRHSDGATYDLGAIANMRDSLYMYGIGFLPYNYQDYLDSDLSRYTDNENYIHNIEVQLRIIREKLNLSVGAQMQPQRQKVNYAYQGLDTIASRNFFRMSPTLNMRYQFSKQHQLRIRYRGNTQQPEITDMFNMTDTSDPLNIREGNPGLKPSFTNNINIDYNNYIAETNQNYVARLQFSNTLNSISNRTEYNEETGGRTTRPENINGNWNINGNFGFRTPLFTDKLTINTNTSSSFNNNVGYIYQNRETLRNNVKNLRIGERLNLTWREEYFDVVLNGNLTYNNSRSEFISANDRDTYDFSYGVSTNGNFDNGFGFSSSIEMSSRRGYSSAEMNTNELIWNAQISYRFLQGRRATVSLQAFDLLRNRSNISRTINATMRSDSRSNAVYSYVMFNFAYRFGKFGGKRGNRGERPNFERGERPDFERGERPEGRPEGGRPMGGPGGGRPMGGPGGGPGGFR